ncbi:MAG: CRISPR-associated protein Cse1 [Immundisolibacter sp.]
MAENREPPCHNLLTEPLIRTESREGTTKSRTLPGVLAALANAEDLSSFPGLQPHQWHAWHAFLVQLAALAAADDRDAHPTTEDGWRSALRGLTPDHPQDEPWCLVVLDLAQPAFMQPPIPEGSLTKFEGPYATPDASALDVLVTATDHDIKVERQGQPEADNWLFCLVAYQTLSGYSGRNNHGVIRMNGGYATRPLVGLARSRDWSDLFRRDLAVLQDNHDAAKRAKGLTAPAWRLLWLAPWDGEASIPWADCDPYAIEVARRVRLTEEPRGLLAWRRPTSAPRLSPKSDVLKGNVGDPWIPLTSAGEAANVGETGWHYDLLRKILLEDGYTWAPCQRPRGDDPKDLWFYAVGLARGQGKTDGFHERWLPIPPPVSVRLFAPESRRELGEVAKERVARTGEARKVLHQALVILLTSAPPKPDFRDYSDRRWLERFDAHVDAVFFDALWNDADKTKDQQKVSWDHTLRRIIEERIWPDAEAEAPVADARRERAQARAWMVLRGRLKKTIPYAYTDEEQSHAASRRKRIG